jgi:uncharacterized protein YjbI with pentapeptide repeats
LTNVVLSNLDPNNALSNAMLTNNALTNAVLSNVVLSNNALSNNALSNNVLSNAVLSNAPLGDAANGGDPEALSTIETGAVEIAKNTFQTGELANSNFKDTTFTIRNRGNIDTILAIKVLLRDAICTGAPNYTCTTPPGYGSSSCCARSHSCRSRFRRPDPPCPRVAPSGSESRRRTPRFRTSPTCR